MRSIFTLAILVLSFAAHAQTSQPYEEAILNRDPNGFRIHMARSIRYPQEVLSQHLKGDALLMFKVDTTGFIDSVTTIYATYDAIAEAAIQALQLSDGRWTAAKRKGRYVSSWMYAPVKLDASTNGNGITDVKTVAQSFNKDGETKWKNGNYREAIQLFNAAYHLDPSDATPFYNISQVYFKTRDNDLACYYLQRVNNMIRGVSAELKQQVTADMTRNCK
jgi:tetratricopeptide (TPR) repeat protein